MYTGDERGFIRVFDLTGVIKELRVGKVKSYESTFPKFFPYRKEKCDVSLYSEIMYKESTLKEHPLKQESFAAGIFLREVLGHKDQVTSINYNKICGLISCSMAGYDVKIWNAKNLDLMLILD